MPNLLVFNSIFQDYNWRAPPRPNDINTRVPFVAATAWGRLATKSGSTGSYPQTSPYQHSGFDASDLPQYDLMGYLTYPKHPAAITIIKRIPTLKRSPWLLVVMIGHPALALIALLVKLSFHKVVLDQNFSIISMLSALDAESIGILKIAALCGRLKRRVGF